LQVTDHSEHGAEPVEGAAVDDPPTVDEVLERQRVEYPEQARTSTMRVPISDEEQATIDAGAEASLRTGERGVDVEGPNSA
jgi:hypothetical protein